MVFRLYNSMGRKVQTFRPIRGRVVRMYTCGPTVWNYPHIGNYRTFVFEDILRRYLKFKGFRVKQVMNITDVEDNIIKGMKEFHKTREELTDFYEKAFMEGLKLLNVEPAELYPRATEHINEMVALVKKLMRKGFAYRAEDGSTYFDISKFKRYGRLSGIRPSELKAGARVAQDHYEKEEANDFALWKAWDEDDGEVYWETELGKGRPGWSIECSAMSMKYLGSSFDIHTGGMDNKFPHHENEIAQSEAATGKRFVRFWLHSEFLNIRGEEMHKSIGNVVYLRDLLQRGVQPMTVRLFLISSRYRDGIDLTDTSLDQAAAQRKRLQEFISRLRSMKAGSGGSGLASRLLSQFTRAMDDDLNTPAALAAVFAFLKEVNGLIDSGGLGRQEAAKIVKSLERVNSVLGVLNFKEDAVPPGVAELIAEREEARRRKDYAESDRIRAELLEKGIVLEDTPSGTVWKRRSAG
ncbi:MAG: cysteine--tRNA ligase [Nitrososphaerales archaeon]|nr:cysteine--tRNA ligase [Nitrososphaerales archaeon]